MRRISLALALVGAVAAAGCGGAGGKSPAPSSGGNQGVEQASFKLVVRGENAFFDAATATTVILPKGGVVTASVGGIDCGVDGAGALHKVCEALVPYNNTTAVTLTATPNAPTYTVYGWAGACGGTAGCSFLMTDTKFVGVRFATSTAGLGAHPPFTAPQIHGQEWAKLGTNQAGAYNCYASNCHGSTLKGVALAPACDSCHMMPHAYASMNSPTTHAPQYLDQQLNPPAAAKTCDACHMASTKLVTPGCNTCHGWPIGPHFDGTLDAFSSHEASGACVRCHTTGGYQYFTGVGVTGTPGYQGGDLVTGNPTSPPVWQNFTTQAFPAGALQCAACHNSQQNPPTLGLGSVIFPSGYQATGLDNATAACVQCHQGRKSKLDINAKIGAATPDQQLAGLTFQNGHYGGAGATLFGNLASGWAEYPTTTANLGYNVFYTGKNDHGGVSKCTYCHNAHTGELPEDGGTMPWQIGAKCGGCHSDENTGAPVTTFAQLEEQRQYGFNGDIDGNGVEEGLKFEIQGLGTIVFQAMKAYSKNVVGTEICYDAATNPYFFNTNADGSCNTAVQYANFTPRLLRAAYNYQWFIKDPGAWAHNPRYAIENLFDSITDLNNGLGAAKIPFAGVRSFDGHFGAAPTGGAFNHSWNNFTGSNTLCAVCHSGNPGFTQFIATYGGTSNPVTNDSMGPFQQITGFQCATCHSFTMDPSPVPTNFKAVRSDVQSVRFNAKYGVKVLNYAGSATPTVPAFTNQKDMICASCHTGYETAATVATAIGVKVPGDFSISVTSPHYLGAASVMFGSDAGILWQYANGKTYAGVDKHHGTTGQCTECHSPQLSRHSFEIDSNFKDPTSRCNLCHNHLAASSGSKNSYNRDQNVAAMKALLLQKINAYQVAGAQSPVCYDGSRYSYWFKTTAANGGLPCLATDTTSYGGKFDSTSVKAAFNFFFMDKEPGAWAHNYAYSMQVMFDAMLDLDPSFDYTNLLPIDASCLGPVSASTCPNGAGRPIAAVSFGR